jgi:hypothetical protein
MSTELAVKLAGIFMGVLARTLAPWLRLFCLAFGFGWNAMILEGGEWAGALKPRRAAGWPRAVVARGTDGQP